MKDLIIKKGIGMLCSKQNNLEELKRETGKTYKELKDYILNIILTEYKEELKLRKFITEKSATQMELEGLVKVYHSI